MARASHRFVVMGMVSTIEPFIHRKVVVLHQDTNAVQVARAMSENRIGCVVLADHEGHITGVVTDRDLVCGLLAEASLTTMTDDTTEATLTITRPVSDFMTEGPATVQENATLQEVVGLMEAYGVRRVPVVHKTPSGREKCVGIVTLDDLVAARSIDYDHLARVVQSQIFRRRGTVIEDLQSERAELRSEAHMEQTFNHFFNVIATKTDLNRDLAVQVGKHLLSSIVQRMHYTGAAQLIAQLPHLLQDELLDLPAGPNRRITGESLVGDTAHRFGFSESVCRTVISRFWAAMEELVDRNELDHTKAQLTDDIKQLFTAPLGQKAA